jgi:hypothetical protein
MLLFLVITGASEVPTGRHECTRAVIFAGAFTPD